MPARALPVICHADLEIEWLQMFDFQMHDRQQSIGVIICIASLDEADTARRHHLHCEFGRGGHSQASSFALRVWTRRTQPGVIICIASLDEADTAKSKA
jgi:hypothetical protein